MHSSAASGANMPLGSSTCSWDPTHLSVAQPALSRCGSCTCSWNNMRLSVALSAFSNDGSDLMFCFEKKNHFSGDEREDAQ